MQCWVDAPWFSPSQFFNRQILWRTRKKTLHSNMRKSNSRLFFLVQFCLLTFAELLLSRPSCSSLWSRIWLSILLQSVPLSEPVTNHAYFATLSSSIHNARMNNAAPLCNTRVINTSHVSCCEYLGGTCYLHEMRPLPGGLSSWPSCLGE